MVRGDTDTGNLSMASARALKLQYHTLLLIADTTATGRIHKARNMIKEPTEILEVERQPVTSLEPVRVSYQLIAVRDLNFAVGI